MKLREMTSSPFNFNPHPTNDVLHLDVEPDRVSEQVRHLSGQNPGLHGGVRERVWQCMRVHKGAGYMAWKCAYRVDRSATGQAQPGAA